MLKKNANQSSGSLSWWQLSLIGVGCIIGTGYFLGSSIAIKMTGPSVLLAFTLAALGTYIVFESLAKMTVADPQEGSFRSYAKKAYGRWAGFSSGWVYWFSEMLIMGSQLTALSIFSTFWFPDVPLWVFASIFAVLGIGVILTGTKGFERIENLFAVIKIAAIFMFIILALLGLFGVINGDKASFPTSLGDFFPKGAIGFWTSLIYAFYAFGGIEIMGIMAMELKNKEDAPKSGSTMLILLTSIYLLSLALAVSFVSWEKFNPDESPFVTAMASYNLDFFPHVFNGALIIAGFSTMAASLFAVTSMTSTLAKDGDAPALFKKKKGKKRNMAALSLTIGGLITSIILALVMPDKIYEYITTAAGLMLLYNWFFVLLSAKRLLQMSSFHKIKRWLGMVLILAAISGTLFDQTSRPGFFVSIAFILLIFIVILLIRKKWNTPTKNDRRLA
ncbi:amino acid permease [Bacillus weihaiensis]|uniref:amino acid permease n=1 Tax=Bacillus weihaiensis TaxID=1547283 RepID=UPI003B84A861